MAGAASTSLQFVGYPIGWQTFRVTEGRRLVAHGAGAVIATLRNRLTLRIGPSLGLVIDGLCKAGLPE
jgi:hypothetical protein